MFKIANFSSASQINPWIQQLAQKARTSVQNVYKRIDASAPKVFQASAGPVDPYIPKERSPLSVSELYELSKKLRTDTEAKKVSSTRNV